MDLKKLFESSDERKRKSSDELHSPLIAKVKRSFTEEMIIARPDFNSIIAQECSAMEVDHESGYSEALKTEKKSDKCLDITTVCTPNVIATKFVPTDCAKYLTAFHATTPKISVTTQNIQYFLNLLPELVDAGILVLPTSWLPTAFKIHREGLVPLDQTSKNSNEANLTVSIQNVNVPSFHGNYSEKNNNLDAQLVQRSIESQFKIILMNKSFEAIMYFDPRKMISALQAPTSIIHLKPTASLNYFGEQTIKATTFNSTCRIELTHPDIQEDFGIVPIGSVVTKREPTLVMPLIIKKGGLHLSDKIDAIKCSNDFNFFAISDAHTLITKLLHDPSKSRECLISAEGSNYIKNVIVEDFGAPIVLELESGAQLTQKPKDSENVEAQENVITSLKRPVAEEVSCPNFKALSFSETKADIFIDDNHVGKTLATETLKQSDAINPDELEVNEVTSSPFISVSTQTDICLGLYSVFDDHSDQKQMIKRQAIAQDRTGFGSGCQLLPASIWREAAHPFNEEYSEPNANEIAYCDESDAQVCPQLERYVESGDIECKSASWLMSQIEPGGDCQVPSSINSSHSHDLDASDEEFYAEASKIKPGKSPRKCSGPSSLRLGLSKKQKVKPLHHPRPKKSRLDNHN